MEDELTSRREPNASGWRRGVREFSANRAQTLARTKAVPQKRERMGCWERYEKTGVIPQSLNGAASNSTPSL